MTKLKNTKKGMAKKALSISLVAAMLATSNVPVWAAEDIFTSSVEAQTDVDVFTQAPAEDVAPFVEEVENADNGIMGAAITEQDITVNLATARKNVLWNSTPSSFSSSDPDDLKKYTVGLSGTVTKADGSALSGWKFRWVDEGGVVADKVTNRSVSTVGAMDVAFPDTAAGHTLTLHIYDDSDTASYDIKTNIEVNVQKRAIADITLSSTAADINRTYNGFAQTLVEDEVLKGVTDEVGGTVAAAEYKAAISSATKVGEAFNVTVTANDDSAYTGSFTKKAGEIEKKPYKPGDIVASTEKNQTYQYTGKEIVIDNSKVALKESKSTNESVDGKLNGNDLSAAIKKAVVTTDTGTVPTPADRTVTVTVDEEKLDNISANTGTTVSTEETVKIAKRDLSTAGTKITVDTVSGFIPTSAKVDELDQYLTFTGVEGGKLALTKDTDYVYAVTDSDGKDATVFNEGSTYNITVRPAENSTTCEKEQTIRVVTTGAALKDVTYKNTYEPFYTGAEIKPTKDNLGVLELEVYSADGKTTTKATVGKDAYEIVGYTNNINASKKYSGTPLAPEKEARVNIKITSGTYANMTCALSFAIKPLIVEKTYVTVPENISYNANYTKAEEYNIPVVVVAKDKDGKNPQTLSANDYTVKYEYTASANGNTIGNSIKATVTVTNPNFIGGTIDGKTVEVNAEDSKGNEKNTEIVAKILTDSMVVVNPSSYTYTGGKIEPNYVVMDGAMVLYKKGDVADAIAEYEEVSITDAVNVGTATITVKGYKPTDPKDQKYSGTAKGTFTITPADTSSVKVSIDDQAYTGRQIRPRDFEVTLNGNNVSSQFEIVSYGENVAAGTGTVVLKPLASSKNFTGSNITANFNIVKENVTAKLSVYDAKGFDVTDKYALTIDKDGKITNSGYSTFNFDGNAKTFAKAVLSKLEKADGGKTTATVNDLEIKYVDNVSGKKSNINGLNIGYIYAVAKDGTGFAGKDSIVTADGTIIKGVVAKIAFGITAVEFVEKNVTVKDGSYAGGLPVKPEILIQIGGNTLVEGKDYTVKYVAIEDGEAVNVTPTDVTAAKIYGVDITGINGYEGSYVTSVTTTGGTDKLASLKWGINKKNLNDCDITVKDGVATVMNGYIPVPTTEYTVKDNADKTYTVSANTTSKNYTGSKTVTGEGQKPEDKPVAPTIQQVNVVGNKATVVLEGNTEGSTGYDYVISTSKVFTDKASRVGVNANVLSTQTTFRYVDQGVYYAYLHSWKRGADGKKVFSAWSNAYPFVVSSITPDQPTVTSVKVSGKKVTVTYTKTANATGYDIVLGSKVKKVNGEKRPVEYGKLVKKVTKGNVVTATFTNVPKGTYYAGLHAYNRTSENNGKVFSVWSNTKKVTVK